LSSIKEGPIDQYFARKEVVEQIVEEYFDDDELLIDYIGNYDDELAESDIDDDEQATPYAGLDWIPQFAHLVDTMRQVDSALFTKNGKTVRNTCSDDSGSCACILKPNLPYAHVDPPSVLSINNPTISDMGRRRVYVFVPEFFYNQHLRHMRCPLCQKSSSVIHKGWNKTVFMN
jgi:hypothetical protein